MDNKVDINAVANQSYVPSSLERKRSLLMYLLIGIIISSSRTGLTQFEEYHFKQALGYRLVVILWVLIVSLLFIVPNIWIVFLPISVALLIYLVVFIQQTLHGKWQEGDSLKKKMFYGLGTRTLHLFEN